MSVCEFTCGEQAGADFRQTGRFPLGSTEFGMSNSNHLKVIAIEANWSVARPHDQTWSMA
jgi:hypothetical protein